MDEQEKYEQERQARILRALAEGRRVMQERARNEARIAELVAQAPPLNARQAAMLSELARSARDAEERSA